MNSLYLRICHRIFVNIDFLKNWCYHIYVISILCTGVWSLKIPLKIKHLLWRILWNCLPTRVRLQDKGVQCPLTCSYCKNLENSWHIFFWMWECNLCLVSCWSMAKNPTDHVQMAEGINDLIFFSYSYNVQWSRL